MSAILRLRTAAAAHEKVFVWYDFKQVRDAILLVLTNKNTNDWEKVFVYENAGGWDTEVIKQFTDEATYTAICKRLQHLFNLRNVDYSFNMRVMYEHYSIFLIDAD